MDKKIELGDQTCSKEFLIGSRQCTEQGSVSSQTHPPMWPANHCTGDTKLACRKSQENTKPSAALLNLNEWEKKCIPMLALSHRFPALTGSLTGRCDRKSTGCVCVWCGGG